MTYLRSFVINFLFVFFIDRVTPGIEIVYFEQVPDVGADILFSVIVGFLNASVFPFLSLLELKISKMRLAILTFILSFGSFGVISVLSFGVSITAPAGFFVGGTLVWIVAYFSNYLEWKYTKPLS